MSDSQLDTLLSQLHDQLSVTTELDASTKKLLQRVSEDINALLDQESSENTDDEQTLGSDSLKKMAVEFEAEHPRLAHTINELAESLAKIGI